MLHPLSLRRLVENEVVFREYNESIQQGLARLSQMASEDGQVDMLHDDKLSLHFYCECSDENCRQRIVIEAEEYQQIHKNRNRFIMMHDHQVSEIEHVVMKRDTYSVVEKFIDPPETANRLHHTSINNS